MTKDLMAFSAGLSQLLDQAVLKRQVFPFYSTYCLAAVRVDGVNVQIMQRTAELSQSGA